MAVDAFHLIGGATDISCYLRGQLLIAGSVVIVNCSATVAEQAKDGRVECVMGCLNGLLFDRDRLEAEPPRGIFQRSRRKMIDVFCIEFLERGVEIIDVSSCVRRFQIQITSRCEQAASGAKEFRDVVDVLEDVAEHNAVKLRHVRWSGSAGNRADVGLKAPLATRSGTTRQGSSPATAVNPMSRRAVSRPPVAQPASRMLAAREGRKRAMSAAVVESRAASNGEAPLPVAVAESSYFDHSQ